MQRESNLRLSRDITVRRYTATPCRLLLLNTVLTSNHVLRLQTNFNWQRVLSCQPLSATENRLTSHSRLREQIVLEIVYLNKSTQYTPTIPLFKIGKQTLTRGTVKESGSIWLSVSLSAFVNSTSR